MLDTVDCRYFCMSEWFISVHHLKFAGVHTVCLLAEREREREREREGRVSVHASEIGA